MLRCPMVSGDQAPPAIDLRGMSLFMLNQSVRLEVTLKGCSLTIKPALADQQLLSRRGLHLFFCRGL